MKYKAVVFDLFGTIVDFLPSQDYHEMHLETARVLDVPAEEYRRLWDATIWDRDRGTHGDLHGSFQLVCEQLGICPTKEQLDEAIDIRLKLYARCLKPRDGVMETLTALKAMGLKLGLISGCGFEVPMLWKSTPFSLLFDAPVFSCDARMSKPEPSIYLLACERLGVTPNECLYVADGMHGELTGASSVGMHAVLIRVSYDHHLDCHRKEVPSWTGPTISRIPDILSFCRDSELESITD